jgi:phage terminase large subunit-like protein
MQRVADDPARAPHVLAYLRNTPTDADPWDEANWLHANPALGDFLSIQALRDEALEARNDPAKENAFRQFRLAQWVRQQFRWMPMHLWDATACVGDVWATPDWGRKQLAGKTGWFGFDLAAKFDLTAWAVLVPDGKDFHVLWRFWIPEEALVELDKHAGGQWTRWARDGWLTVTEGNVVDYDRIYRDVEADAHTFRLRAGDADQWSMAPVVQEIEKRVKVPEIVTYSNTYQRMTPGMNEVMAFVKAGKLKHHGNPVAHACFEAVEVLKAPYDPEMIRPAKPDRGSSGTRIDAVPALAMAAAAWRRTATQQQRRNRVVGY